jgi:hypothetical protein
MCTAGHGAWHTAWWDIARIATKKIDIRGGLLRQDNTVFRDPIYLQISNYVLRNPKRESVGRI